MKGFGLLFGMLADQIEALLADKGYDADAIRAELANAGVVRHTNHAGRITTANLQDGLVLEGGTKGRYGW